MSKKKSCFFKLNQNLQFFLILSVDYNQMKKLIIFSVFFPFLSLGQTGGKSAYPFLNLTQNARAGGIGNDLITVYDDDINLGVLNPAVLNTTMSHSIAANQSLLAGGIYHGMFVYGHDIKNLGTGAIHLRYLSYGKMDRMDETGERLGSFTAGDFALGASLGRELNPHISIGGAFNFIWSQLETYSSFGISLDLAGTYKTLDKNTIISAVVRNIGTEIKPYRKGVRSPLPINVMLGISHKLNHAPFRFSIIYHHLNKWDLTYFDPNQKPKIDPLTGESMPLDGAKFIEKLGRHFIFQVESKIANVFSLRLGFDYNRRKEMLVANRPGIGGFSFGVGLSLKRFAVDYGFSAFSSAGYHNMITFRTNINTWRKKGGVPASE